MFVIHCHFKLKVILLAPWKGKCSDHERISLSWLFWHHHCGSCWFKQSSIVFLLWIWALYMCEKCMNDLKTVKRVHRGHNFITLALAGLKEKVVKLLCLNFGPSGLQALSRNKVSTINGVFFSFFLLLHLLFSQKGLS